MSREAPNRLPPRIVLSPAEAAAKKQAREERDAQPGKRIVILSNGQPIGLLTDELPAIAAVPRVPAPDAAAFRARAMQGLPFLIDGVVGRWPLVAQSPAILRERYSHLHVRARVGDYIGTAFAPDRAMQDMTLVDYLEQALADESGLPPYLGNLELRELNRLCHWPNFFEKMGPPRFWIGPAGCITPLHCDYDDNVFAQLWGRKRVWLAPPHHDRYLYPKEANAILFGSPFDPDHPDLERFPLARQAALVCCEVQPGEMLYIPAGWYHQVSSLTFSLSSNRWARGRPLVLSGA